MSPKKSPEKTKLFYLGSFSVSTLLLFGCGDSSPSFVVLDARERAVSTTLRAGDEAATYWVVPFSSTAGSSAPASFTAEQRDRALPSLAQRARREAATREETAARIAELRGNLRREGRGFSSTYRAAAHALGDPSPASISIRSPLEGDGHQSISGTLRAADGRANVYVDARYAADFDAAAARGFLRRFSRISLPRLRRLFGEESDVDGNGRIDLFFSAPTKIGAGVVGFFRPIDLLPGQPDGNEREIVYVQIPSGTQPDEFYDATVAHEVFHLIHFGRKTLARLASSDGRAYIDETTFLSEGLAHLAEEIVGWGICTAPLAEIYLRCVGRTSVAGGGTDEGECATVGGDDSLPRRGASMLFLLRALERAGGLHYSETKVDGIDGPGLAYLRELVDGDRTGIDNLERAGREDFFGAYARFVATLALDGTDHPYGGGFAFDPTFEDPFTGLPRGLSMRMRRTDPSNATFVLEGPHVEGDLPESPKLYRTGAKFYQVHLAPGETKTLSFADDAGVGLGIALIRR